MFCNTISVHFTTRCRLYSTVLCNRFILTIIHPSPLFLLFHPYIKAETISEILILNQFSINPLSCKTSVPTYFVCIYCSLEDFDNTIFTKIILNLGPTKHPRNFEKVYFLSKLPHDNLEPLLHHHEGLLYSFNVSVWWQVQCIKFNFMNNFSYCKNNFQTSDKK